MVTKHVIATEEHMDIEAIREAGEILRNGGLVAFPTETVYGQGGDALQKRSSEKIYAAKGRPSDNPLIVHICQWDALNKIAKRVPEAAKRLAKRFWPGPLTMILEKAEIVPPETTGGLDTVAVRMPAHKVALRLIEAAGGYIAAPSANTSGRPSPTLAEHVAEDLDGKIEMILDGGPTGIGLESTIVDLTGDMPVILRPGYITQEMLSQALETKVELDQTLLKEDSAQTPKAPGMKYRHYAPRGELTVVSGNEGSVIAAINGLIREKHQAGERVGIICTDETRICYEAECIASAGARGSEEEIARRLYAILRRFDKEQITTIYSEAFPQQGIGQAVMNRLLKAAGYRILETE